MSLKLLLYKYQKLLEMTPDPAKGKKFGYPDFLLPRCFSKISQQI